MLINWIKSKKYWYLVIFLFLLLRLPSLIEPYWYGDEGIYLVLGDAIRNGWTLYSQIHDNKPPTLYYLAAVGQTVLGFRLLLMFWMIPAILVFYRLSKNLFGLVRSRLLLLVFLILTSIPLLEGNIANAEIFMLLPTIYGVYLVYLFSIEERKNLNKLIVAGILLGFAFTIKIPVFIEVAFLTLWLIISTLDHKSRFDLARIMRYTTPFLVSFFLPIVLYGVYFIFKNAFNSFLFASLTQNFGYLSSWATGSHSGSATSGGIVNRGGILLLFWLFVYILSVRRKISQPVAFIFYWFGATIFGALLSTRPYPHYLIQILPPLTLVLGLIFFSREILSRFLSFVSISLLVVLFLKYRFYVYPVYSYYTNSYSYLFRLKSHGDYMKFFGNGLESDYLVSEYVNANTSPGDRVFVWGDKPSIYALSGRLPSSKYTVAYHVVDFNQYDSTYDKLVENMPKFVVDYNLVTRPFPQLSRLLNRYYYIDNQVGPAIIYRLRR